VFTNLPPAKYKLELYYGHDQRYLTTKLKVKKNQTTYTEFKLKSTQKPK